MELQYTADQGEDDDDAMGSSHFAATLRARHEQRQQPPCRLLALPVELRERVWRLALAAERAIVWPAARREAGLSPALLATCKQIHGEAAPVLYNANRFSFAHPSDCNVFRRVADEVGAPHIALVALKVRETDLRLWTEYIEATLPERSLAADLPRLRSLVIFLRHGGRALEADRPDAFDDWHHSRALRRLCESLEHRIHADITVVLSTRVRDDARLDAVRQARPDLFVSGDAGHARTGPVELRPNLHVELELLSAER